MYIGDDAKTDCKVSNGSRGRDYSGPPSGAPDQKENLPTVARGFTDRILYWSEGDLEAKPDVFQDYFNSHRVHYSLAGETTSDTIGERHLASIDLKHFGWKPVCGGMYARPIAA